MLEQSVLIHTAVDASRCCDDVRGKDIDLGPRDCGGLRDREAFQFLGEYSDLTSACFYFDSHMGLLRAAKC